MSRAAVFRANRCETMLVCNGCPRWIKIEGSRDRFSQWTKAALVAAKPLGARLGILNDVLRQAEEQPGGVGAGRVIPVRRRAGLLPPPRGPTRPYFRATAAQLSAAQPTKKLSPPAGAAPGTGTDPVRPRA